MLFGGLTLLWRSPVISREIYLLPIQEHVIGSAGLEASARGGRFCHLFEEGDDVFRWVQQVTGVGTLPSNGTREIVVTIQVEDRRPFTPVVVVVSGGAMAGRRRPLRCDLWFLCPWLRVSGIAPAIWWSSVLPPVNRDWCAVWFYFGFGRVFRVKKYIDVLVLKKKDVTREGNG